MLDTHCHLTHERFRDDLPEVLRRAAESGVSGVVCIASDLDDARAAGRLIGEFDNTPALWRTCGAHPHESGRAGGDLRARLEAELGADPCPVAIGECGLDFHYDFSPRDTQLRVFDTQIELAAETGLPLVVHCRDAEEDMKALVRDAGSAGARGVLHCFPGDPELLDVALENGWMVSFTGLVTFGSFDGLEAVRRVPPDRYMLETDGPYLTPVPHRGKRNEPAFVSLVRDRVAAVRGETAAEVERNTDENARHFFGLRGDGS